MDSIVLDQTFPKETQPKYIKITLKQHQLSLLHKCRELEDSSHNPIIINNDENNTKTELKSKFGVIGDIVGSGKTLTILGLISKKPLLKNKLPKVVHKGIVSCSEISLEEQTVLPYNVIIVPHTIFKQWKSVIEDLTELKYYGINDRKYLKKFIEIFSSEDTSNAFDSQIILISNTRFQEFMSIKTDYWNSTNMISRYIFDEADMLKVTGYNMINSSFIWFVSSSYKTLLTPYSRTLWKNTETGTLQDYYNINTNHTQRYISGGLTYSGLIKNIMINIISFPHYYKKHLILRNSDEYVRSAFNLPDYIQHVIKCKTPYYLNVITQSVSQDIINHINAGDLKGAIDKINCPKFSEKDLIKGITHNLEVKLQNLVIELEMKSKMTYSSEKAKKESIENIHNKMKDIDLKITSIKNKLQSSDKCPICYDDVCNISVSPCCNTKYCFECISTWLHQSKQCPFCRASIDFNSLIIVSEEEELSKKKNKEELLDKLDNLTKLIETQIKNPKFKMLIFSEYNSSFEPIETILKEFNINYSNVMGTTNTINKTIRLYKDFDSPDKIDVLLLNANFCANGMNLENSSDIVLYHSMNKDRTTQIIGRGQRPGRVDPLNVWHLCYENEL